jgi:hypothetical protein
MKTLRLYAVTFEGLGLKGAQSMNVAALNKRKAEQQTKEWSSTIKKVNSVVQVGVVNVPVAA